MKKIKQNGVHGKIKKENFNDVLIPVYNNIKPVVHRNPIYGIMDKQWNKDFMFIDKMKKKVNGRDIINKQDIIIETFRNRFTALFTMNVNSVFNLHNQLILQNQKIRDRLSNYNLLLLYEENPERENKFLFHHLNAISNLIEPTPYCNIIHNVDNYNKYPFEVSSDVSIIYNNAFNIETYFTEDSTIIVDLTNLFSSYLIKQALSVLHIYGVLDVTLAEELNNHIIALSSNLYDVLSMFFIVMYETANQYYEFIITLDNNELQENNKEQLDIIISNAINKLSALNDKWGNCK